MHIEQPADIHINTEICKKYNQKRKKNRPTPESIGKLTPTNNSTWTGNGIGTREQ